MFTIKMQAIYGRLLILGLLLMCLFVFGYSDKIETVQAAAAPCQQDCDKYLDMCIDYCQTACSSGSTDPACNSCIFDCFQEWNDCSSHSIYCTSGTVSYSSECQVQYGIHCVDVGGGSEDCDPGNPNVHNGYSLVCNRIGYANGCVECPALNPDENCYGGGSSSSNPPQCL